MDNDTDIDSLSYGKEEKDKIKRVKEGGLKPPQKWGAGKKIRVPEGKIPLLQFSKGKITKIDKLTRRVRRRRRKDHPAVIQQRESEHEDYHENDAQRRKIFVYRPNHYH